MLNGEFVPCGVIGLVAFPRARGDLQLRLLMCVHNKSHIIARSDVAPNSAVDRWDADIAPFPAPPYTPNRV